MNLSESEKKIIECDIINHSTQDSRVVPHRGTNWAAPWLTSQIGRDAVLSRSYGRGYISNSTLVYKPILLDCATSVKHDPSTCYLLRPTGGGNEIYIIYSSKYQSYGLCSVPLNPTARCHARSQRLHVKNRGVDIWCGIKQEEDWVSVLIYKERRTGRK